MISSFPFSEDPHFIIELPNYYGLSTWLKTTAHVSSACIGVCDHTPMRNKIIMARVSFKSFLEPQQQR